MPKRNITLWLWVWGWAMVSIVCALTSTEAGTIAAEIAAALAAIVALPIIGSWIQHRFRPFTMQFTDEEYEYTGKRHYTKEKALRIGKNRVLERLRPIIVMEFERINLGLV